MVRFGVPSFSVSWSASGGVLSTPIWQDPPSTTPAAAPRLNGNPLSPQRYRRVQAPGGGGSTTIYVAAVVNGVTGPSDASLGGALFSWVWSEAANPAAVLMVPTPGYSSKIAVTFLPGSNGHHLLSARMQGGGAIGAHLDVEA